MIDVLTREKNKTKQNKNKNKNKNNNENNNKTKQKTGSVRLIQVSNNRDDHNSQV